MKILFILGIIFLCANVLRFVLGNIPVFKKEIPWYFKLWNVIESVGISVTLFILILYYYR